MIRLNDRRPKSTSDEDDDGFVAVTGYLCLLKNFIRSRNLDPLCSTPGRLARRLDQAERG
jgi:hypothetical protein